MGIEVENERMIVVVGLASAWKPLNRFEMKRKNFCSWGTLLVT